jgi:hypothetical protein
MTARKPKFDLATYDQAADQITHPPGGLAWKRRYNGNVLAAFNALARAKKSGDTAAIIDAAERYTSLCQSENRLYKMIMAVGDQPAEVFWPVWLTDWPAIDYSAEWHEMLPGMFKRKGPAHSFYDADAKAVFDGLPNTITVYRGCDERFVNGVSWTTDLKTAGFFATGGRYGRPDNPTIVTGTIKKSSPDLFYVSPGESEVVCSPKIKRIEKADLDRIMGTETINGEPDFRS